MKERNLTLDIMKGIGIITVIAGHTKPDYISAQIITSFHMPLFFIISGYLYKHNNNYKIKIRHDFSRLLIPYLVTSIITLFTFLLITDHHQSILIHFAKAIFHADTQDHTSLIWAHIPKIGPIWFLFALFWCKIVYNTTDHYFNSSKYIVVIIISIIAVIIDRYIINLPFSILPGLSAMIFYLIGEHIHHNGINKITVVICACCWIIHIFFSQINMCICMYKLYPIDICGAIFGTIVIFHLSKAMQKIHILSNTFAYFGRMSLVILCAHTYEWSLLNLNEKLGEHIWTTRFIVEVVICISLTYLWTHLKNTLLIWYRSLKSNDTQ